MAVFNLWRIFVLLVTTSSIYGLKIKLTDVKRSAAAESGRVRLSKDGETWGGIQPIGWENKQANVVCQMMGYRHGEAVSFQSSGQRAVVDWVDCSGDEVDIWHCNIQWNYEMLVSDSDGAGVRCFNTSIKIIQYSPLTETNAGSVIVFDDYKWRSVCDDQWDDNDATVACRQAGFVSGKSLCCSALTFQQGFADPYRSYTGPETTHYGFSGYRTPYMSSVTNVQCSLDSTDVQSCSKILRYGKCSDDRLASVICYQTDVNDVDQHLALRFVNGSDSYGKIQVRRFGQWGNVMSSFEHPFTDGAANVSCRMMGYKGGVALTLQSKTVDLPYWMSQVNCSGSETSLEKCKMEWGAPQKKFGDRFHRPAGAICYKNEPPKFRLTNGTSRMGRVELVFDGVKGSICDLTESESSADVICAQLGFRRGSSLTPGSFGRGSSPVLMTTGRECRASVWQCWLRAAEWMGRRSHVQPENALAVSCENDVRLSGGTTHQSGIVQVYKKDYGWTSVTSQGFGAAAAKVVCTELGYAHGQILTPGTFGESEEKVATVKYFCSERDTTLSDCVTFYKNEGGEDKRLYAAVHCYNSTLNTTNTLELKTISTSTGADLGELSVHYEGFTGQVCAEGFREKEASVACRELGYRHAWLYNSRQVAPSVQFAIQQLTCDGRETSIFDCVVGTRMCPSGSGNAGVICYNNTAPVLKLVNPGTTKIITRYTGTETVCSTASQLCQTLGSSATMTPSNPCQAPVDSIIQCSPTNSINVYRCHAYSTIKSCTRGVRLVDGDNVQSTSGSIEMMYNSEWVAVAKRINSQTARLVCQALGASYYKTLPVNVYNSQLDQKHVTIECEGREATLSECQVVLNMEVTPDDACVVCSSSPIDDSITVERVHLGFNTMIRATQYNISGYISSSTWSDTDSNILCKSHGFSSGKTIGETEPRADDSRMVFVFYCSGQERDITQCTVSASSMADVLNTEPANVFCYNDPDDFSIRLSDLSDRSGLVQIRLLGTWGNICFQKDYLTAEMVNSICRDQGFASGSRITSSESDLSLPVLLNGVNNCFKSPLWQCRMKSFNITEKCVHGSSPLAVRCEIRPTTMLPPTTMKPTTSRRPWHGHKDHGNQGHGNQGHGGFYPGNDNNGATPAKTTALSLVSLLLMVIYRTSLI